MDVENENENLAGEVSEPDNSETTILLTFTTSDTSLSSAVPSTPFSLSLKSTAQDLNLLLSHLISNSNFLASSDLKDTKSFGENDGSGWSFSFLHEHTGKILQAEKSLLNFVSENGLSTEERLDLVFLVQKQLEGNEKVHEGDNWYSCLAVCSVAHGGKMVEKIFSGSYAGVVDEFNESIEKVHSFNSGGRVPSPVKCAVANENWLCYGSRSGKCMLQQLNREETGQVTYLNGHTSSVEAATLSLRSKNNLLIATSGWDKNICLYNINQETGSNKHVNGMKRRKVESEKESGIADTSNAELLLPDLVVTEHNDKVSSVDFLSGEKLLSGSFDTTLKVFDIKIDEDSTENSEANIEATNVWVENTGKVITKAKWNRLGQIATSHSDAVVRIWDIESKSQIVTAQLRGHKSWVSDVCWSSEDPNLLASCDYNGSIIVWDVRSRIAATTLDRVHTSKAFALQFVQNDKAIVSCGADSAVRLHTFK